LQLELLNEHEPFASIEDAQAAVGAWRKEYNADRPHQSLAMAFPAARFVPATGQALGLHVPANLAPAGSAEPGVGADGAGEAVAAAGGDRQPASCAVELDRVVPPSGNLWVAGQQIWLGPAMTGRLVRIWADTQRVCVLAAGHRIKTLPSRLDASDLATLRANGAVRPVRRCRLPLARSSRLTAPSTPPATSASAATSSAPDHRWPGSGSPCGWTGRSRISSPAAPRSAPSLARSRSPPGTGSVGSAPEPLARHGCPNPCRSSGGYRSVARS
jgi:hypothetical protein